jgi:hypothetical protein
MQKDKQFRVAGDWALASDGVQWVLQRRHGKQWHAIKFIRSTKDHLALRMQEKGVPPDDAARLLDGLPDTFDEWLAAERGLPEPYHDDLEGSDAASMPETVE